MGNYTMMPHCKHCKQWEPNYAAMTAHVTDVHGHPMTLKCQRCNYESEHRADINRHYNRQHPHHRRETTFLVPDPASQRYLDKRRKSDSKERTEEKKERKEGERKSEDMKYGEKRKLDVQEEREEKKARVEKEREKEKEKEKEKEREREREREREKAMEREKEKAMEREKEKEGVNKQRDTESETSNTKSAKEERWQEITDKEDEEDDDDDSSSLVSEDGGEGREGVIVETESQAMDVTVRVQQPDGTSLRLVKVAVFTERYTTINGKPQIIETTSTLFYPQPSLK